MYTQFPCLFIYIRGKSTDHLITNVNTRSQEKYVFKVDSKIRGKKRKFLYFIAGCPRRSYKVVKGLIFVFPFIRVLERSYV